MKYCKILLFLNFLFQICFGYELCRLLSDNCQRCIADKLCTYAILDNGNRVCVFTDSLLDYPILTLASTNRKCAKLPVKGGSELAKDNLNAQITTIPSTIRAFQTTTVPTTIPDFQTTTTAPSTILAFQTSTKPQVFHDFQTPTTTASQGFRDIEITTIAPQSSHDLQTPAKKDMFVYEERRGSLTSPLTTPEPVHLLTKVHNTTPPSDHFSHSTTQHSEMTVFHTNSNTDTTIMPDTKVTVNFPTQEHTLATNPPPATSTTPKTNYLTMPVSASVIIQDDNENSDTPFIFITTNLTGPSSSQTKQPKTNTTTTTQLSIKTNGNIPISDESNDAVSNSTLINVNVTEYTTTSTTRTTINDFHNTHNSTLSLEDQLLSHSKVENELPATVPSDAISYNYSWKTEDYVIAIAIPSLVISIVLMWMLLISFYKRRQLCNFVWFKSSNHHRRFPGEQFELADLVYADQGNLSEHSTENETSFTREGENSSVVNLMTPSSNEYYWDIPL